MEVAAERDGGEEEFSRKMSSGFTFPSHTSLDPVWTARRTPLVAACPCGVSGGCLFVSAAAGQRMWSGDTTDGKRQNEGGRERERTGEDEENDPTLFRLQ